MVRDWDQDPVQPLPQARANVLMIKNEQADMDMAEEQIGFRKLKLRAQITAQFEIK
jgi:hypothetical protein